MDTSTSSQAYTGLLRTILRYIKPVWFIELLGVLCLILHSFLMVLVPEYVKRVINHLEDHIHGNLLFSQHRLYELLLWILGLSILSGVMMFLARWLIIGASRRIERTMRNDFLRHIQQLSPRFYHNIRTGDLITRFASDIEAARLLIGPGIMYPGTTGFTTVLALYSMYSLNVELTHLLLVPVVILLVYVNINTRFLHRYFKKAQEVYSNMSAVLQENFSGIRVIKAYTQEKIESQRFKHLNREHVDWKLKQINMRGKLYPFMKFIGSAGSLLILWVGGFKVINGTLQVGELVQFTLYLTMLMWPIIALGWVINVIHRGMASWRRLYAVMSIRPDILDRADALMPLHIRGEIEVRNLTFSYHESLPPVLKNLSFKIQDGQTLAVVGPTGSGKSTIVNVLLHMYPVPRNCVFIDGMDINQIPLQTLRKAMAYISQDVFLFSDTLRSNILFGVENGSAANLENALLEAAAHAQLAAEVETFPLRYDTEVGERGITLSGGQKQRTGIARALVLHRPILILDDCLSNVDAHTEEALLQSLTQLMHHRTTIMISHRVSTIQHADHIIVLDDGEIVEEGTHDQLIAMEGFYAGMYSRQLLEESLGIRT